MALFKRSASQPETMRTCNRCGKVWYGRPVDPRILKAMRMEARGHRGQATGSRLTIGGGRRAASHELRANQIESQIQNLTAFDRCPSCNSESYTQGPATVAAPAQQRPVNEPTQRHVDAQTRATLERELDDIEQEHAVRQARIQADGQRAGMDLTAAFAVFAKSHDDLSATMRRGIAVGATTSATLQKYREELEQQDELIAQSIAGTLDHNTAMSDLQVEFRSKARNLLQTIDDASETRRLGLPQPAALGATMAKMYAALASLRSTLEQGIDAGTVTRESIQAYQKHVEECDAMLIEAARTRR